MSKLVGQTFGEFQLVKHIGAGGMADVYLAEQTALKRPAAVKILKPALMAASPERVIARFRQEAMSAAGLTHANIVQVYTIGEHEKYHYIAQEFVNGKDLASILQANGPPQVGPALNIIRQVATALAVSNGAGIVHRDIKPDNILVSKEGIVKVADFGLAQLQEEPESGSLTKEGSTLGTPLYMSPEQVRGETLDIRSDIYSLGITCYQVFSGQTPFSGTTATGIAVQHVTTKPPPLSEECPHLPTSVCRMVHCMINKDPADRYQTPGDIVTDIKTMQTAIKQKRSLDLIRLPVLSKIAPEERAAPEASGSDRAGGFSSPVKEKKKKPKLDSFEEMEVVSLDGPETRKGHARRILGKNAWVTLPSWEDGSDEDDSIGRRRPEFEEMDLTPMVDVTFLLLIFFMITAAFDLQKAFNVAAARSEDSADNVIVEDTDQVAVTVEIASNNTVFVEDKLGQTLDELTNMLTAAREGNEDMELHIRIDPASHHEMRIRVNDAGTRAGFTRIRSSIGPVE